MPAKGKSIKAARHLKSFKVGADRNLPLSKRDVPFDGAAAKKRIFTWAGFDGDNPDSAKARKVFLLYDSAHPNLKGSYKLPFADIVDGKPTVIRAALRNAASRLPQTDAPQEVRDRARKVVDQYLVKFRRNNANALADLPSEFYMTAESSDLEILASQHDDEDDGKPRIRKFKMTAYSGGLLFLAEFPFPVVVNLQGLQIPKSSRPILRDHKLSQVIGHSESIAVRGIKPQLHLAGIISGANEHAKEIIESSDMGFPWQSSIGGKGLKMKFIDEGQMVKVNGQQFRGPILVAEKSILKEVSFVALGADQFDTPARIAATRKMEAPMDPFTNFLEAKGIEVDDLSDEMKASWKETFDEMETIKAAAKQKPPDGTLEPDPKPIQAIEGNDDPVAQLRKDMAIEAQRAADVRKLCTDKPEMLAKAIAENWDVVKTELEVRKAELETLRASRPSGPAIHDHTGKTITDQAMTAALCLSNGLSEDIVAKDYDEKTMELATSRDLRGAGLHALFYSVIQATGGHYRPGAFNDGTIRAAFEAERKIQAHGGDFSTISLAGTLSNVANKVLLNAFIAMESIVSTFSREVDVNDFKVHERFRLTSAGIFEKVAPDGEIKHTELTEEKFTNQIDTFGKMIALTRQTIINDDLDAFLDIPRMLGRQGALKREREVFELILNNAGPFFSTANKNLQEGATTNLQISSLTTLEQLFLDQTDTDGNPILVNPKFLLVPTSLKVTAKQVFTDQFVNETTTTDSPSPEGNPHQGKWDVLASPFLNSQGLTGSSPLAFYFFANPNDIAAIEIAYLNGLRTPTMDSSEMDFNVLGMQWRAFWDFGVAFQDFRGAAKSKGEV